jgi:hypothetical protein
MSRHRQLAIGLSALIGGLAAIAIGTIFPSSDAVVALGWLLLLPLLVSLCGVIFISVSLARSIGAVGRSVAGCRIVGLTASVCLGLGFGYGALGIVSQVPDSLAGLNGAFVPDSAPGLGVFVCSGVGLLAGLMIGAVEAIIWRSFAVIGCG